MEKWSELEVAQARCALALVVPYSASSTQHVAQQRTFHIYSRNSHFTIDCVNCYDDANSNLQHLFVQYSRDMTSNV